MVPMVSMVVGACTHISDQRVESMNDEIVGGLVYILGVDKSCLAREIMTIMSTDTARAVIADLVSPWRMMLVMMRPYIQGGIAMHINELGLDETHADDVRKVLVILHHVMVAMYEQE